MVLLKFIILLIVSIVTICLFIKIYYFINHLNQIIDDHSNNISTIENKFNMLLDEKTIIDFKNVVSKLNVVLNKTYN
jgi:hypothetical protein